MNIDDLVIDEESRRVRILDKEMVLAVLAEYEKLFGEHKAMVENYEKLEVCLQKVGVILE